MTLPDQTVAETATPRAHRLKGKDGPLLPIAEYIERCIERIPFSGCWIWIRSMQGSGYGTLAHEGRSWQAHRFVYTALRGEIEAGLRLLHRCDVRLCVNPDHLFVGTDKDNMIDCYAKQRHSTKIATRLQEMQNMLASGLSRRVVAARLGVHHSAIYYWLKKESSVS